MVTTAIVNLFLVFILAAMLLCFIAGIIIFIRGKFYPSRYPKATTFGLKMLGTGLAGVLLVYAFIILRSYRDQKINEQQLPGMYHVVEANEYISKDEHHNYTLHLTPDGTYTLSKKEGMPVLCTSGSYSLNYIYNKNEIEFSCDDESENYQSVATKNFIGFQLEFIIGEPGGKESIYFQK